MKGGVMGSVGKNNDHRGFHRHITMLGGVMGSVGKK
jgi:hypothetical protein